jgi:hypothetical protein
LRQTGRILVQLLQRSLQKAVVGKFLGKRMAYFFEKYPVRAELVLGAPTFT